MGLKVKDRHVAAQANIKPSKIAGGFGTVLRNNNIVMYVDGDDGLDTYNGLSPQEPKKTIQAAVTAVGAWGIVYVMSKDMAVGATDPGSYDETVIIPATHEGLSILGVGTGRTQGGLPQIKKGSGSTALLTVRAPGCTIANMGFNGAGSTGGGVLIDDDSTTKCAFGLAILNCHFKNCKAHATNGAVGGAIYTAASGSSWQILIQGCRFYKCKGGIVMTNTSSSVPQDWVIEDCVFGTDVNTATDVDIYVAADGIIGLSIRNCSFDTVDVPAGTSGTVQRYIQLGAGTKGNISNCNFACISQGTGAKTFGAAGTACIVPTTVRMSGCHGEPASDATGDAGDVFRT